MGKGREELRKKRDRQAEGERERLLQNVQVKNAQKSVYGTTER